ncbi:MAG: hypothetical protein COT92_01110 [Candidatus Doudnabacteria bacterium CG10_big_fil_rev_8_21_14_0_10_42_18]|uniref:Uncharacterized protein n=1 Tax=Candidatus Doudnabacteria bacterium CG10_big_fil_rev_8_21_14_0_10_42_18 TaxID=1974552 RepID=A0A2H0VBI8_9BACT|nr:MAG: hypothetical protein COT92_01110 [Candidatus Doudnabacteria bacterium CG10_big_fil_rev_8_21_14_0_10_42_18]
MKVYTFKTKTDAGRTKIKTHIKKPKKFNRPGKKKILTWLFRLTAVGVVFTALLFLYYAKDLPDPNKLLDRQVAESTKIFDREGKLVYEIHGEVKRTQIALEQVPKYAIDATIALEDKDFYKHHGISITGILRSAVRYVINRGPSGGGGSTITQQFVKNAILSTKQTFDRKLREAILSIAIEARFEKNDILKLYLNEIPYGRNAYGIEAASEGYFGKKASELSLAESAYLAALPQAPSYYNPLGPNRESLDNRKNVALRLMREQGYITEEQEQAAKEEQVEFIKTKTALLAPHFVLMVQNYLADRYGETTLREGGLQVYTTLDSRLQEIAERVVKAGVEANTAKYNANNAGLVAIDPKTGQILAMVGSKDYFADPVPEGCAPGRDCWFEPNVNVALSPLQPGSSFKPFVYVTAFGPDYSFSPATMIMDVETNFGKFGNQDYVPQNYDNSFRGPVSIRTALAGSLNIPAVKALALVGVGNAVQTARNLGITSPLSDCGLSLVLGGCEVKLLDHVAAYSVFANGGIKHEKTSILKVLDNNDKVLEEYEENPREVLDPQAVYQLVNILSDNSARAFVFGLNNNLTLPGRPVAAKTGTTQKYHDGWTVGFTPSLAAGVWAGNNDGTFMKAPAGGSTVAAPIWHAFMTEALADTPAENFSIPKGVNRTIVDSVSGKLPTQYSPSTKEEVFADYNTPTEYDDVHIVVPIDSATGLPATVSTPQNRIYYQPYTVLHSEQPSNPDWENPVKNWAIAHGYLYPPFETITNPENGQNNNGESPQISIIKPLENDIVSGPPYNISVIASSANGIGKVELFIDGNLYKTLTAQPYEFFINQNISGGKHTLAAKATDLFGRTSDTSVSVVFGENAPLNLTEPSSNSLVIFPITLAAKSPKFYSGVTFYYIDGDGDVNTIGKAGSSENIDGVYRYSLNWKDPLAGGQYKIFAKTETGQESDKVTITVP